MIASFYRLMPVVLVLGAMLHTPLAAAADPTFDLTIRNHKFTPETLTVPANTKFRLRVRNDDPTPEEFESHELNREKVIPGGRTAIIYIGPLKPGKYPFVGEFHEKTAKGHIIAK